MEPTWNSPDAWQKDGASISSVSSLKKGAWTSILTATETHNGKKTDVVIKQFAVPEEVLEDPERIALEREKFLTAARLQKMLTQSAAGGNARAWVKILRLDELGKNPSFTMEKLGPSLQDLIDNKVQLSARQLYSLVQAFLLGLIELKDRAKRSHGNVKPSDVLSALPGQSPPFKLADPAAKGEEHSANDLYSLGLILYQLIEGREWDPLNPITPSKGWQRFKGRRDRWMQFCNMLLNPNGCHESLVDVRREAYRLKPASAARYAVLAMGTLLLVGIGAVSYHFLVSKVMQSVPNGSTTLTSGGGGTISVPTTNTAATAIGATRIATTGIASTGTAATQIASTQIASTQVANTQIASTQRTNTTQATTQVAATQIVIPPPTVDPAVRTAYDDARRQYRDASQKWNALVPTPRYDHTKSAALARDARAFTVDSATLATTAQFQSAAQSYQKALAKMNQALEAESAEETAGQQADAAALADFQKALADYNAAKAQWDEAAAKFTAAQDHTRSTAQAQAALIPDKPAPTDPVTAKVSADEYRTAAQKLLDSLKLIPEENLKVQDLAQAQALFDDARKAYLAARDQWSQAEQLKDLDLTAARAVVDEVRKILPDQIVLRDVESYRSMAGLYQKATDKLNEALVLVNKEKTAATQKQTDVATAVNNANKALADKKYAEALDWYRKAANMGNPSAMRNVGLLYETGKGTTRDETEAAKWYRMAADQGLPGAMYDLGYLYETGRGVDKDAGRAAQLYRRAAELKFVDAMVHLGICYENGWGVTQDYAESMKWYHLAADANDPAAMNHLGVLYDKGKGAKADPAEALKWYKKAADLGSAAAMNNIGILYNDGRGVKADFAEAMKWYKKAGDLKYAPALCNIGVLYDNGNGTSVNHAEALKWFQQAAELGDGQAMFNLGFMYESGRGVNTPDIVEAVNWYRKAFRAEDENAKQLAADALDRLKYAH